MINIDSIAPINTAIDLLGRIKTISLDIEVEMRENDPTGNFAEAIKIAMIEILPDDYPLDTLDAAANLLNLCTLD